MRLGLLMVPCFAMACSSAPSDPNEKLLSDLASKEDKVRVDAAEGLRSISLQLPKIEGAKEKMLAAVAADGSHRGTLAMVMAKAWGEAIIPELIKGLRKEGSFRSPAVRSRLMRRTVRSDGAQGLATRSGGQARRQRLGRSLPTWSGDIQTALAFIELLGVTGSKKGTQDLLDMVADSDNNFIVKNCIIALGNIRDPKAIDVLIEHMFRERMKSASTPSHRLRCFSMAASRG